MSSTAVSASPALDARVPRLRASAGTHEPAFRRWRYRSVPPLPARPLCSGIVGDLTRHTGHVDRLRLPRWPARVEDHAAEPRVAVEVVRVAGAAGRDPVEVLVAVRREVHRRGPGTPVLVDRAQHDVPDRVQYVAGHLIQIRGGGLLAHHCYDLLCPDNSSVSVWSPSARIGSGCPPKRDRDRHLSSDRGPWAGRQSHACGQSSRQVAVRSCRIIGGRGTRK
jgi:hypothetical protein